MVFPLLEYARSTGRNTADFNANDIAKANQWWDSLHKNHLLKRGFIEMGKIISAKSAAAKASVKGKLTKQEIEEVQLVDDVEVDENVDENGEVIDGVESEQEEIVMNVGFTQADIDGLKWACQICLETFDFTQTDEMIAMEGVLQGLIAAFPVEE